MSKIVYVIGSLDVGGAETHLFQLLPKLKQKGWDVEVYCIGQRGVLADALQAMGVPVTAPLLSSRNGASYAYRVVRIMFSFVSLLIFLLRNRPKVVHCFLPKAYLMGGVCSILSCTPYKMMSRRSLNTYQLNHPLSAWFEKKLHHHMDIIMGNSKAVIDQLEQEGVERAKLRLVYNGVNDSRFNEIEDAVATRRALGISDSSLVFVIVANLIPYKGHKDLLDALALIASKLPKPWDILIIGRDDGIGSSLKKQAQTSGISNSVKWLGARKDIPSLLKASDIGVLSSLEEGFSNAILECMASSLPMVVTDVGGNGEAVEDGITGLVVPPGDPLTMAQALLHLALNESVRNDYALAAQNRVKSHFSLETCVNQYDAIYNELLDPQKKCVNEGGLAL